MAFLHSDQLRLSTIVGGVIFRAGKQGALLTDAGVTAADTLNGLDSFIDAAVVHSDNVNYKRRTKTSLRKEPNINDAAVLNLTSVAGLYGLTNMGVNGRYTELLDD